MPEIENVELRATFTDLCDKCKDGIMALEFRTQSDSHSPDSAPLHFDLCEKCGSEVQNFLWDILRPPERSIPWSELTGEEMSVDLIVHVDLIDPDGYVPLRNEVRSYGFRPTPQGKPK